MLLVVAGSVRAFGLNWDEPHKKFERVPKCRGILWDGMESEIGGRIHYWCDGMARERFLIVTEDGRIELGSGALRGETGCRWFLYGFVGLQRGGSNV